MSFSVRRESVTAADRAAVESQAVVLESSAKSPMAPLMLGAVCAVAAMAAFQWLRPSSIIAAVLVFAPGMLIALGFSFVASGRRGYSQAVRHTTSAMRQAIERATEVDVFEIEAASGQRVGGMSDWPDQEWSGALLQTTDGSFVFMDELVLSLLPREGGAALRRSMTVRAVADGGDPITLEYGDQLADEGEALSEVQLARLASWVRAADDDALPCREVPAGIIG